MKKNKNNKGFTLIEILAVIIILGILVIIAIPAVTRYIENSRREAYIDTAKQIIGAAKNYLNSDDELDVYDNEVTYYMPISCFKYENGAKSINGNFTLAYVGFVYKETDFDYYWVSVDEEGEGIRSLTSYDDLDVDKIESGIEISDIDTTMTVGGTIKTIVFNNDCSETQESKGHIIVTFDANGGEYNDGSRINTIRYSLPIDINKGYKVSHTSNISDDGIKQSDYGNNWNNANITGSDRGDTSKAHVVTIPGATALHVKITYGGESANWDWACMWQGSYPNYTAASNCGSSITGKLGGGNYTSSSNTKEYDVSGDTVTFAFKSDGSYFGDGYGYYAVVTDKNVSNIDKGYEGTYYEPTKEDYLFDGWEYNGKVYKTFNNIAPSSNVTYKAKWVPYSVLRFVPNGGYVYINGTSVSSQTDYKKIAGSTLSFNGVYRSTTTYSSGSYTTTYNSNGGSTTPSSHTSTRYYSYYYSFKNWQLTGDCDNFPSETSTSGTYTFPDSLGEMCIITPQWTSTYSGYYAYSFNLAAAPTREGYIFAGWKSSKNNQIYQAGASYTPTGSYTMTAQWVEDTPDVDDGINYGTKKRSTVVVGDIVKIGNEEFYVIVNDRTNDRLTVISRYNLNVGPNKKGGSTEGRQDSEVRGVVSSGTVYGTIAFYTSSPSYWVNKIGSTYSGVYCTSTSGTNCVSVFDSNSELYQYVSDYKTYLESLGVTVHSARLMTLEESRIFQNAGSGPKQETSYWLASPYSDTSMWYITNTGGIGVISYNNSSNFGIRPVIII